MFHGIMDQMPVFTDPVYGPETSTPVWDTTCMRFAPGHIAGACIPVSPLDSSISGVLQEYP